MASGSSGRPSNSGSKGFDFAADDVLCSYEDYTNQEPSNGNHSEHVIGTNSSNDFQKSRMSRSSVFPATNAYSQPEDSFNQELILIVERTVKKHTENLMRFLEGISSRLSQLELYCYNLDKSIGEMRSDLVRDHGESDAKLKSLDKHLQEVHRSVQILRDKQELAETQKELAKLHLAQKESGQSPNEERSSTPTSDSKKMDDSAEVNNQQLALALPHQVTPQPNHPTRPVEQQQNVAPAPQIPQPVNQQSPYYLPQSQLPNPQAHSQALQGAYMTADSQYRAAQMGTLPSQGQVNQTPQAQQYAQYQQQWPQQAPQPVQQPPQQPSMPSQNQVRAPSTLYAAYMAGQPASAPPPETHTSSMPMQVPFQAIPQPGVARGEVVPYGYGGVGRSAEPQHMKSAFPPQHGDGYTIAASHLPVSSGGAYVMYEDGARAHHPSQQPHYPPGAYSPGNASLQSSQPPSSAGVRVQNAPQFVRNHPYGELIDKLISMGYRGDHVASVIQRLEESGQPVDFNAVLDRLNGHSSGGSQRGW